jgi:hypothetical protein
MAHPITKTEARAFRDRWRRVNGREEEELRSTSLEIRLQQFNTLLGWAQAFGWTAALGAGEAEVRGRGCERRTVAKKKLIFPVAPALDNTKTSTRRKAGRCRWSMAEG